jgi:hypothetical protein
MERSSRSADVPPRSCPAQVLTTAGGILWGGRPRPQPDPLVGLGLVPNHSRRGASGAVQGDRPTRVVNDRTGDDTSLDSHARFLT